MSECNGNIIPTNILQNANGLRELWSFAGVFNGENISPPNQINPYDEDLSGRYEVGQGSFNPFSYLTAERDGFNVGPLFDNENALLRCLSDRVDYNSEAGRVVWQEVNRLRESGGDEAVRQYLSSLSPDAVTNYDIYQTLHFIQLFRGQGDTCPLYNVDGDRDVISREDIIALVFGLRDSRDEAMVLGAYLVASLHSLLGLANYVGSESVFLQCR